MENLVAFFNDESMKQKYVDRMESHAKADEIIQGETWKNGKGCFIGCSFHEYSHFKFKDIGLPIWFARLADKIFEGLSNEDAKEFAKDFYKQINVGANVDKIKIPFLIFICESVLEYVQDKNFLKQKTAIENVIIELKKDVLDIHSLRAATDAAASVSAAAYAASVSAAAYAASVSAAAAAYAASVSAAAAAAAYAASVSAAAAARQIKYKIFADKLFELIRDCK